MNVTTSKKPITTQDLLAHAEDWLVYAEEAAFQTNQWGELIDIEEEETAEPTEADLVNAIIDCIMFREAEPLGPKSDCPVCGKIHTPKNTRFYCDSCGKLIEFGVGTVGGGGFEEHTAQYVKENTK